MKGLTTMGSIYFLYIQVLTREICVTQIKSLILEMADGQGPDHG